MRTNRTSQALTLAIITLASPASFAGSPAGDNPIPDPAPVAAPVEGEDPVLATIGDTTRSAYIAHSIGDIRASLAAYFSTRDAKRLNAAARGCREIESFCSDMAALDQDTAEKAWLLGMQAGTLGAMIEKVQTKGAPTQAEANAMWSRAISLRDAAKGLATHVASIGETSVTEAAGTNRLAAVPQDTTDIDAIVRAMTNAMNAGEGTAETTQAEVPADDLVAGPGFQEAPVSVAKASSSEGVSHGTRTPGKVTVYAQDPVTTFLRSAASTTASLSGVDHGWNASIIPAVFGGGLGLVVGGFVVSRVGRRGQPQQSTGVDGEDGFERSVEACAEAVAEITRCLESVNGDETAGTSQTNTQQKALFDADHAPERRVTIEQCVDKLNLLALSASIEASKADEDDDRFRVLADELQSLSKDLPLCAAPSDGPVSIENVREAVAKAERALVGAKAAA